MNFEKILKIALFLQIVLLIFLTYPSGKKVTENLFLSTLDKSNIEKIIITEKDKNITLVKKNDLWTIQDKFNFPASPEKVAKVLDTIFVPQNLRLTGKTKNALKKFKLTAENNTGTLKLFGKDGKDKENTDTLILGDMPEFKKIYIRNEKNTNSLAIDLSKFDLSIEPNNWYLKNFLGISKDLVKKFNFSTFSIAKKKNDFVIENVGSMKDIKKDQFNFLLNRLFNISFLDIVSENKFNDKKPDFTITVEKGDGTIMVLNFIKAKDLFIMKTSTMPWDFSISKNLFNALSEYKLSSFF